MMDVIRRDGYEALWGWFGLSYSSFCVMPRILMHAMPDKWQGQMAKLLEEYEATFNTGEIVPGAQGCKVLPYQHGGRFMAWPCWVLHYRRPDESEIARLRRPKPDPDEERICPSCRNARGALYVAHETKCYGCGLGLGFHFTGGADAAA